MATDTKKEKSNKFDTPETKEMVRSWLDKKKDTQQREVLNPKKKEEKYHDKTTLDESQRHPHSTLKTQKEYKEITDSDKYKKAGWQEQNKMLKTHPTTMKKGGKVKKNTRRENRLEELGRVDAEKGRTKRGKRNLKSEKRRIVRELHADGGRVGSRGVAIKGFGKEIR